MSARDQHDDVTSLIEVPWHSTQECFFGTSLFPSISSSVNTSGSKSLEGSCKIRVDSSETDGPILMFGSENELFIISDKLAMKSSSVLSSTTLKSVVFS